MNTVDRDVSLVADDTGVVTKAALDAFKAKFMAVKKRATEQGQVWDESHELLTRVKVAGYRDFVQTALVTYRTITFDEWYALASGLARTTAPAAYEVVPSLNAAIDVLFSPHSVLNHVQAWNGTGRQIAERALASATTDPLLQMLTAEQKAAISVRFADELAKTAIGSLFSPEQLREHTSGSEFNTAPKWARSTYMELGLFLQEKVVSKPAHPQNVSRSLSVGGHSQPARYFSNTGESVADDTERRPKRQRDEKTFHSPLPKRAATSAPSQPDKPVPTAMQSQRPCHWCGQRNHHPKNCQSAAAVQFNSEQPNFAAFNREQQKSTMIDFKDRFYKRHPDEKPNKKRDH
jgi:hypothetical protein